MKRNLITLLISLAAACSFAHGGVVVRRIAPEALQPQVLVDNQGTIHLIYFTGDPLRGDVSYTHSSNGKEFAKPMRVNSIARSVVAAGSVRGAQLALGRDGRVHIAWNGSDVARKEMKTSGDPLCYTRLNDAHDAFEPQRNLINDHYGLDGGGSIAADALGNVFVFWHAPEHANGDEADRAIWFTQSKDDGKTFGPDAIASQGVGVCACCGMRAWSSANDNSLLALFRSATDKTKRDIYLLASFDNGKTFDQTRIDPMSSAVCILSTIAMISHGEGAIAAWETRGRIMLARIDAKRGALTRLFDPGGKSEGRKHPALAINQRGEILLAWTTGTAFQKGGDIEWKVLDAKFRVLESGQSKDVPASSFPAAWARPDGSFVVSY